MNRDIIARERHVAERTVRRLIAGLRRAGVDATVVALPETVGCNYYFVTFDGRGADMCVGDGHVRFKVSYAFGREAWYQVPVPKRRLRRGAHHMHSELVHAIERADVWVAVQDMRRNERALLESAVASIALDGNGHVGFSAVENGAARLDMWAYVTPEQATHIVNAAVACGALRRKDG